MRRVLDWLRSIWLSDQDSYTWAQWKALIPPRSIDERKRAARASTSPIQL